jgi:predicted GH43/DUF377 family glycosyl hydrolase
MTVAGVHSFVVTLLALSASCVGPGRNDSTWQLGPFVKADSVNPVLGPNRSSRFYCPVRKDTVRWEEKDVFNPSAVVRNDTVFLLYRAEDVIGKHAGTSRLGLAFSSDGLHFTRLPEPVFYPEEDIMKVYEWEGGVEDPRLVQSESGLYVLTYTAYDGTLARLCVATSPDLRTWTKHGLAFRNYPDLWSKSGAIVSNQEGSRFVAKKINGRYYMYWGDTHIFLAKSADLIDWKPVVDSDGKLAAVISPRAGRFDSDLVEPGPHALYGEHGILLIYNSRNRAAYGDAGLPDGNYAAGQVLLDRDDPSRTLERATNYCITPDKAYEITGQVNNVCFAEGLAYFRNRWFLYYGTADSRIAVAVSE